MASDKEPFSIDFVLRNASVSEKCSLLAGADFWHTTPIPRLNIPSTRLSDGPNGVRGTRFFNGVPAACLPCGTALGATWNTDLICQAGRLIGREAKAKGASVWLGPTINIQRSPLGGRGFESFSEDPVLSGLLAAAIITGVQSEDVIAVPKHFVCNDQEDHRRGLETIVTGRALREIYLKPFEIALAKCKPDALMTAYNKVNGTPCSQSPELLNKILREEWGFRGTTISDWFGTYSTVEAVISGLDLEMPGPTLWRGRLLEAALSSMTLSMDVIDERVRHVLQLIQKASKCHVSAEERELNTPDDQKLLRQLAVESIVLLKNADNVLPWSKVDSVGVIGVHAKTAAFCGGGSAQLDPYYVITPIEGLSQYVSNINYCPGAYCHQIQPLLGPFIKRADGKPGVTVTFYNEPHTIPEREPLQTVDVTDSAFQLLDYRPPEANEIFYASMTGMITPEYTAMWDFGITCHGTAMLYIDDELIIDNATKQRQGGSFFGNGTAEELGHLQLEKNHAYKIRLEWGNGRTSKLSRTGATTLSNGGARIGGCPRMDPQKAIDEAVLMARNKEHVIIFTGLNQEIESEGYDRKSMDLPGHSDTLIDAVLETNPNTVVVIQSGTPVTMPWAHKAKAILQAWYGGNELGNAIADVIFGKTNPSGKLPMTFPKLLEDNPTYLNFSPDIARALYGEDIFVGYRFYEKMRKTPLFAFGHGLSYTTFGLSDLKMSASGATVKVKNTGSRYGAEVIQLYISPVLRNTSRPVKELKAFSKILLAAGEVKDVTMALDRKATSVWCEVRQAWVSERGEYEVLIGTSSDNIVLTGQLRREETEVWRGL